MEGLFLSRESQHFEIDIESYKVIFPICTVNRRVNNYASRQRKGKNRRTENTVGTEVCYFPVVLTILPSITTSIIKKTVKQNFDSSLVKTINY